MKDRLKKKLKVKKTANQLKTGKQKTYEMPDDYKGDLEFLSKALRMREEYTKKLSLLDGEDKKTFVNALQGLDKKIDIFEDALAKDYENHQKKMQVDEEIDEAITKGLEAVETLYIYIKAEMPHKFERFHQVVTQDMTETEIQEFLDRIAVREADASQTSLRLPVSE